MGARVSAQTQAVLGIQTYAGLTITGSVGTVYSIEYVMAASQTNWHSLEFLQQPASLHFWVDRSTPATGKRFYRAVAFPAPTNMVFIPPGTYRMGSPTNEVGAYSANWPQTDVTISRGFWMGKFEVTQAEYLAVMGTNPSLYRGAELPVGRVSWSDATNYCARLTQREQHAGRIPWNSAYRLPTDAQWEYACRAWTSTRFSYGDDPDHLDLGNYAWYCANSCDTTQPVGQLLPNPWGLYDMHGNVWEWCQDWWTESLPGGVAVDPQGPITGADRVIRGGSCRFTPDTQRSASRHHNPPERMGDTVGFRVVLVAGER